MNPKAFISQPILRSHNFHQCFKAVLYNASIKNSFEEHTRHTPVAVLMIRFLRFEHDDELAKLFKSNLILTSVTASTFHVPQSRYYRHSRNVDENGTKLNTDNTSAVYPWSSHITVNNFDELKSRHAYPLSGSSASNNTYKPKWVTRHHPHCFLSVPVDMNINLQREKDR